MNEKINLTNGGTAVVMVGHTGMVREYANNPSVRFIDTKEIPGDMLDSLVPANSKVVIITEGIPNHHYHWIMAFARRKGIPFIKRNSNEAIYQYLKSCFPNGEVTKPTIEEVKETISKGKLNVLLPFIDFSKSNVENARALELKAKELDIKTTLGSLSQLVANHRKKQQGGTVPKSARSRLDVSVDMLDGMIKDLTDMREFLIAVTEENRLLKDKHEKFKKMMEAMQ